MGSACGCARMRGAGSRNSVCGSERGVHARRRGWPVARENQKARLMAFATKSGSALVVALRLNERPKRGDVLDRADNGDGLAVCRWARCSGSGRRIACDLCRFAASAVTRMIRTRHPMFLRAVAIRHHHHFLAVRGTHLDAVPLAHRASSRTIRQYEVPL
jgi:hypothetical protein